MVDSLETPRTENNDCIFSCNIILFEYTQNKQHIQQHATHLAQSDKSLPLHD